MARSNLPPVTPDGGLRNYVDQLLLAALAIGLPLEAHCSAYDESKEGANRALQRLTDELSASSRYAVIVWAMNRKLLVLETLSARHPKEAYEIWLEVVRRLEATPLEPSQLDLLISYTSCQHKTLNTHWSHPHRHPAIKQILDHVGLPAAGQGTFAIVISAAAFVRQLTWENIPGPEALTFRTPDGVSIALSGPPALLPETLRAIKAALGLAGQKNDTSRAAD